MMKKIIEDREEEASDNNNNKFTVNWSDLCEDMVEHLASHLATPRDYISFRGVCHSWRSLTPPLSHLPWLLLHDDPTTALRRFYIPIEDRVRSFDIPGMSGCFCVGYSKGWLLMLHKETKKLSLVNPFSSSGCSSVVPLPPPPKGYPGWTPIRRHRNWRRNTRYIQKMVLSNSSPTSADCVIVILFGYGFIAVYKPGEETWSLLNNSEGPFVDALFYNDQLLVMNDMGMITAFEELKDDDDWDETTWDEVPSVLPKDEEGFDARIYFFTSRDGVQQRMDNVKFYIVESSGGDLMMALQLKHDLSKGKDIKNMTAGFILFRFENTTYRGVSQWVKVESLGEEALFLGKNESRLIVVSDADSLQGVKKNHIYFTEYEHGCFTGNTVDPHWDLDMGVYSLDDGSVSDYIISKKPYLIGGGRRVWESPPIWLN